MARVTVHIPDDLLDRAVATYAVGNNLELGKVKVSRVLQVALGEYTHGPARPEASGRGRTETLRSLRAARQALDDLERGLTQTSPVRRHVRRV